MEQKKLTVLAIGAHIGDAELTAGALLASCAVRGGKAVTLALTAGEKGAPPGADIAEYRRSKIAEAEAFARELGGEAYVLDYADGLLPDNDQVRFQVCDIIRAVKPDIVVTYAARANICGGLACRKLKIPQTALDILLFLANNPQYNTASDITQMRGIKANLVSINVEKLARAGYLERLPVPGDRRKVMLRCTQKAQPIIQQGRRMQQQFFSSVTQDVSPELLRSNLDMLAIVNRNAANITG